jgi:dTDP-4-amino-4,6-dideoxygalactose transaminase
MDIPFNKPFLTGKEAHYLYQAVYSGKISGNGIFTQRCQEFFQKRYGFRKALLTTSCTDALEMAALLIDIKPDDEVIMPSYTFVSTANAFILRGAKIIFADSLSTHPNLDSSKLEELITQKTRAIVPVHYGGTACDMDEIMSIANKYNLYVIEDAAQAINGFYKGRPLGSIGHFGAFSFHETKNIISGEGGMLAINDQKFEKRAEIIWEKGTNRAAFWRGEVDKYNWVDIGSSFLPSELIASFLYAQLENLDMIQEKRTKSWNEYYKLLLPLQDKGYIKLPVIPEFSTNNAHIFYIIVGNIEERDKLASFLKQNRVWSVFHYLSLHASPFYIDKCDGRELENSDYFSECLLRLPLYFDLSEKEIEYVVQLISTFYQTTYDESKKVSSLLQVQ